MSGDYARWLANKTAAALEHDLPRPSDPFACIPDTDGEYAGTPLETSAERARDRAFPVADEDVTFPSDSSPSAPLDNWDW